MRGLKDRAEGVVVGVIVVVVVVVVVVFGGGGEGFARTCGLAVQVNGWFAVSGWWRGFC